MSSPGMLRNMQAIAGMCLVRGTIPLAEMPMSHLTLADIAKAAGVSPSTVSRVLNNQVGERSKVRARILQVIEETGFRPHAAAQSLAARRANNIGLLVPAPVGHVFSQLYFLQLAQYITQASQEQGYLLSLFLMGSGVEQQKLLPQITRQGFVDGLIVRVMEGIGGDPLLGQLTQLGVPLVASGRPAIPEQISYVAADNYGGAHTALTHLLSLGRKRIGLIVGSVGAPGGHARVSSYGKVLTERGIAVDEQLIVVQENGYLATQSLLKFKPDAIYFATSMALDVLLALREAGAHVPQDIALVGFDDLPLAQQTDPPLTTMRQPIAAMGQRLVHILLDIIANGATPVRHVTFEEELVIRRSCGALG